MLEVMRLFDGRNASEVARRLTSTGRRCIGYLDAREEGNKGKVDVEHLDTRIIRR